MFSFYFIFCVTDTNINPSSSSQAPKPTSTISTQVLPTDKFSECDVGEIMALGFSRIQVISELRHFNGDKTQATGALFAKALKF